MPNWFYRNRLIYVPLIGAVAVLLALKFFNALLLDGWEDYAGAGFIVFVIILVSAVMVAAKQEDVQ